MIFHDFWFDNYFNYVYFYLFFNDLFYFFPLPGPLLQKTRFYTWLEHINIYIYIYIHM